MAIAAKNWMRTKLSLVARMSVSVKRDKNADGKSQSGGREGFFHGCKIMMPATAPIKPVMNQPRKAEKGTPKIGP